MRFGDKGARALRREPDQAPFGWIAFTAMILLLAAVTLGGGASRADAASLIYLRPIGAFVLAALLVAGAWREAGALRVPLGLLAAFALLAILQLVPLPPTWWIALPGHAQFAEAASAAGIAQPWRPISIAPDLTVNALLALVIPAAILVTFAKLPSRARAMLVPGIIVIALASAVLGALQLAAGEGSSLYLYRVSHRNVAVGLFANRNHQAALLAIAIPALRVWWLTHARRSSGWGPAVAAIAAGAFLLIMVLATGSRAGVVLAFAGVAAASFGFGSFGLARNRRHAIGLVIGLAAVAIAVAMIVGAGRAITFERLAGLDAMMVDSRFALAPITWQMALDMFPWGAGLGTFDPLFRIYEPDAALDVVYFNHAHNDLVELGITGGVGALALAAGLAFWTLRKGIALWRVRTPDTENITGRLGAVMIGIMSVASLVDYPLRTPLMAAIFALACGWVAMSGRSRATS